MGAPIVDGTGKEITSHCTLIYPEHKARELCIRKWASGEIFYQKEKG